MLGTESRKLLRATTGFVPLLAPHRLLAGTQPHMAGKWKDERCRAAETHVCGKKDVVAILLVEVAVERKPEWLRYIPEVTEQRNRVFSVTKCKISACALDCLVRHAHTEASSRFMYLTSSCQVTSGTSLNAHAYYCIPITADLKTCIQGRATGL